MASSNDLLLILPHQLFADHPSLDGPGRRVAIIDGVPRREGETFDGVRLRRIHPGRIELVVNGQVQQVHLAAPPAIRTSR